MIDFLRRIFSTEDLSSRDQANQRLRLVLTHDRVNITADMMEVLKEEIIQVIARHFEIDGNPEVNFINEGRHTALDINIPLKGR